MDTNNREEAEKMFDTNISLAYSFYHKKKNDISVEQEDLLQECLKSLWIASLKYDASKGYTFSTFAYNIMNNKFIDLISDYKKNNQNLKIIYYEESTNHDKIESGEKEIIGLDHMGEIDLNLDLSLDNLDNQIKINQLKKIYGEDIESMLLFMRLKNDGYGIPNIKIIMNYSDNDIEKIRRKLRIMRKNSHNLDI